MPLLVSRVVDTVGAVTASSRPVDRTLERNLLDEHRFAFVDADTLRELAHQAACTAALNVEQPGCSPPNRMAVNERVAVSASIASPL